MDLSPPLISVIIPIYNADKYLKECLLSVQSQSHENFEAILINDGSTDNSQEIAEYFCKVDSRFKLINQVNSGVASARQLGLDNTNGKYIIHCDSDDLMTKKSLEALYASIVKNDSDISIGSYIVRSDSADELIAHKQTNSSFCFTKKILDGSYHSSLWNKLIKKELCNGIGFVKNINYMEDKLFLLKVLSKQNIKISIVPEVVYIYRTVYSGYTTYLSNESAASAIEVTRRACNMFIDEYPDAFIAHIKNRMKLQVLLNSNISTTKIFPESVPYVITDDQISLKHKLVLLADFMRMGYLIKAYKRVS